MLIVGQIPFHAGVGGKRISKAPYITK